jgi:hypothetical protein
MRIPRNGLQAPQAADLRDFPDHQTWLTSSALDTV